MGARTNLGVERPDLGDEQSRVGDQRRRRLARARLYLICDSNPGGRALHDVLRAAIAGGVEIVQLRDKALTNDELESIARETASLCRQLGALLIVNDHPAIARAAGADGVHVGQDDMPVTRAREIVGQDLLVGLSTHRPAEIDAAGANAATTVRPGDNLLGVDYIGVGPVYSTPTKPGRAATGLDLVRYAASHTTVPFFAIGGIHAGNAAAVVTAGARRLAVVRAIAEAPDPRSAAGELRTALGGASERSCFRIPPA